MSTPPEAPPETEAEPTATPDAPEGDDGEEPVDMDDVRRSRRRRRAAQDAADDAIPQLPRPKFFRRLAMLDVFRIAMLAALLVAVVLLRKPCADAASNFVSAFDGAADAAPPADPLEGYELVPADEFLERLRDAGTAGDLQAEPGDAATPAGDEAAPAGDQR